MADYCVQCTYDMSEGGLPEGTSDMPILEPGQHLVTICEGCCDDIDDVTVMDYRGRCIGTVGGSACARGHRPSPPAPVADAVLPEVIES